MRAKFGGCMFPMKRGAKLMFSKCNAPIPVCSKLITAHTHVESLRCSRKEETFTISLGKVGD